MPDVAEFPIPENPTPEARKCVQFSIPDEPTHIKIFVGWFRQLTLWFNWERDTGKNGKDCAKEWAISFSEMIASLTTGCNDMYFRFREKPGNSRIMQAQWAVDGAWEDILDNTCCVSPAVTASRITDDGQLQVSYDGGVTWVTNPDDPRQSLSILPAPVGSTTDETRCMVAQSVTRAIQQQQEKMSNDAAAWGSIGELVAALLELLAMIGIIGSGGALTPIIVGIAVLLFTAGKAAFDAAFDATFWNNLQCIIYCAVKPDGSIDQAGWLEMRNRTISSFSGIAPAFVVKVFDLWQPNGTMQAGHLGLITDNDCADCPCLCENHFNVITGEKLETPYYTDYVSFSSVLVPDVGNMIEIRSNGINQCCEVLDVKFDYLGTTGNTFTPFSILKWDCGVAWDSPNSAGGLTGSCVSRVIPKTHPVLNPTDVFVMSVLFADCEG